MHFSLIQFTMFICALASVLPSQETLLPEVRELEMNLTFDDLPTSNGLGKLNAYHHLNFLSFLLLNKTSAVESGLISQADENCATSSPNFLVASRAETPSLWPRFSLDPATAAAEGLSPYFNFVGLSLKVMNRTGIYTCIFIQAYGIEDNQIRAYHPLSACFPPNWNRVEQHLNITKYFPTWGKNVNMVEIFAISGDGKDSYFCIDDIMVEYQMPGDVEWPPQPLVTMPGPFLPDVEPGRKWPPELPNYVPQDLDWTSPWYSVG